MEKIYSLKNIYDQSPSMGTLIGLNNNILYSLNIKESIQNSQVHHRLEQSFEYCNVNPNENPINALFNRGKIYSVSSKKDYRLTKLNVIPGNYYPRIYRPFFKENEGIDIGNIKKIEHIEKSALGYHNYYPDDEMTFVYGLNQLEILTNMLSEILNTVFPSNKNLKSYGHNIKNLLVLSCIEVEAQLIGIIKANESTINPRYNTNNYVKVKAPMQLHKYSVRLPLYPELNIFSPFKKWNANLPTKRALLHESTEA